MYLVETFEQRVRRGGDAAIAEVERFFMQTGAVHRALRRVAARLTELNIPYAVVGGLAVSAHGLMRTTEDVDILLSPEGLTRVHEALEGLGYVPPFPGSKQLRDVEDGVRIEFLISGQYPGDGKPKPVAFPDPDSVSIEKDGIRYVNLPKLIELKLASAMTGAARSKDYGDVEALINALTLPVDFAEQLNEFVRAKFVEKWHEVQVARDQQPG
jgi:hypothetical protein